MFCVRDEGLKISIRAGERRRGSSGQRLRGENHTVIHTVIYEEPAETEKEENLTNMNSSI